MRQRPIGILLPFRSFLMAGGKKSGAGDAVGRRAKRAGVRDLSLILEVGSRECYNDTTTSLRAEDSSKTTAYLAPGRRRASPVFSGNSDYQKMGKPY
ncbi:MAG TPA: hypothetical protein VJJ02_04100 [Candidatus Paceibacterota bacterium]